ncbi:tetratricopeptide (TPR) repeat protein [Alkalibacillus filiformis]|uniref:Tetratricopeptide (TPR) repeat protein n=1 Tax=Alkalibacillus filiformis TaxID=200990 RepID=A0ABU0DWA7_9BACI|nr:helix-turn-helix domain-containing protein [Alkalibacillus filiformis]MDQ0352588.1 tetratricopeptide (TPR) repeat protein [Alkalibacillus filiformis]
MSLIGKAIKWYRTEQDLTQEQLADGICSVTYISKLENGQMDLKEELVLQLTDRLQIDQYQLIGQPNEEFREVLKKWLYDIHIYHIPEAQKLKKQVEEMVNDCLYIEDQYTYFLAELGYCLLSDRLKDADALIEFIEKRRIIFEACEPFSFYKFVGIYYRRKGLYNNAIIHLEKAEDILGDREDPELHLVMATIYSRLNNILVSNKHAQKAYSIFQEKLFYVRMIDCQVVLGVNYCLVGDFYSAEAYFNKLKEVDGEHLLDRTRANIYHHIAYIHFHKKEFDVAESYFKRVLQFNVNESDFLNSRYLLTYIYFSSNRYKLAKEYVQKGLILAYEHNHQRYQVKFKVLNMRLENDDEGLLQYLKEKVIPFFEGNGENIELKHYYYLYGKLLYHFNRYKKASEYFMLARDDFMV